jgi:two-component system phosphate regulon sensor histidine kinase PhoR
MKKQNSLLYYILVFTFAQIAWFSLLGLWIYWYVRNYLFISQVEDKLYPQIIPETGHITALVSGLILLVLVSIGMSLIFIYLTKQMNITRLYDKFIANITHELKSPLSSIQLYLETLKSRNVTNQKRQEFLDMMIQDSERLNKLISTILDISALEQKSLMHNYHIYQFDRVMPEIIEEIIAQLNIPKSAVSIEGSAPCRCVCDRTAFKIVISNLFDNAVKYSKGPVKLAISLNCNQKHAVLKIHDSGIGIEYMNQKVIFQKFRRIYNSSIPNVKGTGLGLYWVKEIIRNHGGRISVQSKGLNQGTTFSIELPIYQVTKKRYIRRLLKISHKSKKLLRSNDVDESI